eukprot:728246-Pleurochrysis_carterae.AAC.1
MLARCGGMFWNDAKRRCRLDDMLVVKVLRGSRLHAMLLLCAIRRGLCDEDNIKLNMAGIAPPRPPPNIG